MHNDGSIEYMKAYYPGMADASGSAEMILTNNNLKDNYCGKDRSPSLSPSTLKFNPYLR
jgi:hypothetical protein